VQRLEGQGQRPLRVGVDAERAVGVGRDVDLQVVGGPRTVRRSEGVEEADVQGVQRPEVLIVDDAPAQERRVLRLADVSRPDERHRVRPDVKEDGCAGREGEGGRTHGEAPRLHLERPRQDTDDPGGEDVA
jgi:hypothetical protein